MAAPRRSARASGVKLSDKLEDLEAHGRRVFYVERRKGWEAEHAHLKPQFPLFDLLPELRARIYYHAMSTPKPRHLAFLELPVLAMVSKQVRAEALPVFFAQCEFEVEIRSDYGDIQYLVERRFRGRDLIEDRLEAREGINTAVRNVELRVLGPHVPTVCVPTGTRPKPVVSYDEAEVAKFEYDGPPICDRIEKAIEQIAASREVFLGFTQKDLLAVAKRSLTGDEE